MSCLANCLANVGNSGYAHLCYSQCAQEPPPQPVTSHHNYPPTPPPTTNNSPVTAAQLATYTRPDGWIFCVKRFGTNLEGFAVNPNIVGLIKFSTGYMVKKFFGQWKSPYLDGSLPPYIFLPQNVPLRAIEIAFENQNKIIKQSPTGWTNLGYPPEFNYLNPLPDPETTAPPAPAPPPVSLPTPTPAAFYNIFNPVKGQASGKGEKNNFLKYAAIGLIVILAIRKL